MNPVLLAASGSLADGITENGVTPAPNAAQSAGSFSLPQAVQNEVAERLRSVKHNQMQAQDAHRQQDNDPAALQALLALFLSQPTPQAQPAGLTLRSGGEMLSRLATAQPLSTRTAASGLPTLAGALAQKGSGGAENSQDLSSLPPGLQVLLTTLSQQMPQTPVTPEQQATLATFSAQDLHAIAPASPSTSQQIAARVKQTDDALTPRSPAVKKNDGVTLRASVAPNQLDVAGQNAPPASVAVNHSVTSAHVSLPTAMSGDELGEKLTALLKDRIQFQPGQQQQTSTIRLDPPSLGKLEIVVQLEAGKLMVHIGASQSDVCRTLQQFSDNLRQHLTAQNFMEVNVQVSSEGQSQQQQPGHHQEEVLTALSLSDEPQHQQYESVLIKV